MKRILITGISGVGKSTVTEALAQRGYHAVDADGDEYSHWVAVSEELAQAAGSPVEADRDWVWREDRIAALLANPGDEMLFVSGCAANMGKFLPQFDHVILLTAPVYVIVGRLQTRTTNDYGKDPAETARVLALKQSVEPLLQGVAELEIDTNMPMDHVIAAILRLTSS